MWDGAPYYVKPTLFNRWLSPRAWLSRLRGLPVPGDEGDRYFPQGYYTPDLGPGYFEGKGREQMVEMKRVLRRERRGQCPFE